MDTNFEFFINLLTYLGQYQRLYAVRVTAGALLFFLLFVPFDEALQVLPVSSENDLTGCSLDLYKNYWPLMTCVLRHQSSSSIHTLHIWLSSAMVDAIIVIQPEYSCFNQQQQNCSSILTGIRRPADVFARCSISTSKVSVGHHTSHATLY